MPLKDKKLMKKIALIDIMGGLRNQLHQISMAKYLKNLGYKIFIITSWFKSINHKVDKNKDRYEIEYE